MTKNAKAAQSQVPPVKTATVVCCCDCPGCQQGHHCNECQSKVTQLEVQRQSADTIAVLKEMARPKQKEQPSLF